MKTLKRLIYRTPMWVLMAALLAALVWTALTIQERGDGHEDHWHLTPLEERLDVG